MRVHEALAEHLSRRGIGHVFTLMSEETAALTEDLAARGVTVMHTRHEHVAVGMADGYSRAGGDVGVAIVGKGPGLTNAVNALTAASKGRSRVLVLVGRISADAETGTKNGARVRWNKFVDQPSLLAALGVEHAQPRDAATVLADVDAALARAREGRTLVVSLPDELLDAECAAPGNGPPSEPGARVPAAADIGAVADLLETEWASRRPVIVAGRGAVRSGARTELERLGERIGALLATSAQAKGMFHGAPFDVGIAGTFATPLASELLTRADVVLAFGASLNQYTTYAQSIFGTARVVHVDVDAAAPSRYQPAELAVIGDARLAAAALDRELERRGHRASGYRDPSLARRLAAARSDAVPRAGGRGRPMHPRDLWVALDGILPPDRALVVDGGNFMEWAITHVSVLDAGAFLWPIDYGAIGCGLGNALGAAVARPDRVTVLAVGDGGLMMALADLDTAVRYRLPVLVVANNNSALGSELHFLRARGYAGDSARYVNPSFEEVARGLGLSALTITRVEDLDRAWGWLARPEGPLLLDCRIDAEIAAPAKMRGT